MSNVVEIVSATKCYGSLTAVDDLSLAVKQGEFLTLLGPSGCGKTTTLRMVSGFETPEQGNIFISGQNVTHHPPFKRDVTTVFQNYALFPHLSVFDNVAFSLDIRRVPKPEIKISVMEMLERVSLGDKAGNLPSALSGGQMQRVALARALVNKPRLLLLDEPLSALDAKLRREMQVELKHMQEELGITFLFVTHDQEEAIVMSDRVAVFNEGRIQQLSSPQELYDRPCNQFVADFMGTENFFHGTVVSCDPTGCKVALGGGIEVLAHTTDPPGIGSDVCLSIRPTKVLVDAHKTNVNLNQFSATFVETIYEGPVVRLALLLDHGVSVVAVRAPEDIPLSYLDMVPGERMNITLPAESVLVYAK